MIAPKEIEQPVECAQCQGTTIVNEFVGECRTTGPGASDPRRKRFHLNWRLPRAIGFRRTALSFVKCHSMFANANLCRLVEDPQPKPTGVNDYLAPGVRGGAE
jgi:hypothetical protein